MSKQTGLIKLKGNLGGISFFQSEGKHLAKMASGPDKERILKDARFQRTRENNSEFGGSAIAAKAFRHAFAPVISMADARFSSRLTGIFKEINKKGEGIRGQRPINVSDHQLLLVNMDFNANRGLTTLFTGLFVATNSADRTTGTITINQALLSKVLKAPEGATHIVFTQALGVISDYAFDENLQRYAPLDAALDKVNQVTDSEYIPLNSDAPLSLTINSVLPGNPVLNENVSVVQCLGVSFYQLMSSRYYPLMQASALKVVKVF